MSQPFLKWYPTDWRADPRLRMCSLAARGLWIELIGFMHEGEPYGFLTINGIPPNASDIAALVGRPLAEVRRAMKELSDRQVFSMSGDTVFSRRMVRDKAKADKDRENGRGGGNPNILRRDIGGVNPKDKAQNPEARNLEEDRIVDARAGASVFTEASKALADAFLQSLGYENPLQIPPEVCGTDWRALEWERAGFTADLIASEARRVGPGKPLSYYEKCFATAFAKRQAPLPKVEVRQVETITVTNNAKPQSAIIQAADDLVRKLASFDGPARETDDLRSGEGETSPRLLSHG